MLRALVGRLAVQRDDGGENVGNLLRGVELARLLAGPGGKLADQVFIGIAEEIAGNSIQKTLLLNVNCYAGSRFDRCDGLRHFIVNRQRRLRLQANNE